MNISFFFMPEYQEWNPSFFCRGGRKVIGQYVPIKGFKLYVFTNSLNNFSAPFTVAATPSKNFVSNFYCVEFQQRPNFEKYGFTVQTIDNKQVVFMENEELIKYNNVVFLQSGDWNNNGLKYHTLGALHDLGIVPSLTAALFSNPQSIEANEKDLESQYGERGDIKERLSLIFSKTMFSLDFFGFTITKDPKLNEALKYSRQISNQNTPADFGCLFDFGTLRFATVKYHNLGFPNRKVDPEIFTCDTNRQLFDSIIHVSKMLISLGFVINDDEFKPNIIHALRVFQIKNRIPEKHCGKITLSHLFYATSRFDISALSLAADLDLKENTINTLIPPRFVGIAPVSQLVDSIPNLSKKEQELRNKIGRLQSSTASSCDRISERIKEAEDSLNSICTVIESITRTNTNIDERLDQATESLESVISAHTDVEERIVLLNNKIRSEARGNYVFQFIICISCILIVKKLISIFY